MFPLLDRTGPNPLELFQIWLNLPAEDKLVDPYFTMLWDADIPRVRAKDAHGRATEITVIAGRLGEVVPPSPPPNSWAARPDADVAIWHVHLEPGARWELPPASGPDTARVLYVFEGDTVQIDDVEVVNDTGVALDPHASVPLVAGAAPVEALLLQGRPIGEPVAQYGPFVMNSEAEIRQAFIDYRETQFGGWPWPDDAPTHGRDRGRFARHVDGRVEEAEPARR
jgi:redox-sensitive bicupin YhaK (pirin superfamily)